MFCTQCGQQLPDEAKFCLQCGVPTDPAAAPVPKVAYRPAPPLARPREGKRIAGVCAAFARHFDIDVTILRICWLLLLFCAGTGLLAYIVCWIVIPQESEIAPVAAASGAQ
jgi:phage shock protein C